MRLRSRSPYLRRPRVRVAALCAAGALTALALTAPSALAANPFDGTGMWIWQLPKSSGGSLDRIGATAAQFGIGTVYVKSSDGQYFWRQFTPAMIAGMKARGLRVCAWQYVYGDLPATEAALGARAVTMGADCLIIDAESEYEGRYAAADTYIRNLRAKIGNGYPLALAGFPYVDYHPSFPYSVFLGVNGAQYNLPQMYWKAIGTSVDKVFAHTYNYNRVYNRRIYPLGQTYDRPRPSQLVRFRQLAAGYRAKGVSWWDWQETTTAGFGALGQKLAPLKFTPANAYPTLKRGSSGDLVVWAQQHLLTAGYAIAVDGRFGSGTQQAVVSFKASRGLPATAIVDGPAWTALLRLAPAPVAWSQRRRAGRAASARGGGSAGASAPLSASQPPLRREIPPKPHTRG
jgi:hypothetical protein